MIKEWIDKQKAKRKLLKFYRMCNKKRKYILYEAPHWDSEQYDKIKWLQYAIAYVLYKDFHCGDFDVEWDYNNHVSDNMEERIYEIVDKYNYNGVYYYDGKRVNNVIPTLQYHTLHVGDAYYNIDDNTMYMWDGKNFQNMC